MKYSIAYNHVGIARDTVDNQELHALWDSQELEHLADMIGWELSGEEMFTAAWVEIYDGDYGNIFITFGSRPWDIYTNVYKVERIWK